MVFQKVAGILAEIIEVEDEAITSETQLSTAIGVDALHVAKLVIECEKKFRITIHDEDVHTFKYVKDMVEYIEKIQSDR